MELSIIRSEFHRERRGRNRRAGIFRLRPVTHRVVGAPAESGAALALENAGGGSEIARRGRPLAREPQTAATSNSGVSQPNAPSRSVRSGDGARLRRDRDRGEIGDRARATAGAPRPRQRRAAGRAARIPRFETRSAPALRARRVERLTTASRAARTSHGVPDESFAIAETAPARARHR